VWEWCNLTPSRKCASVHRSVLLCFTILFFSPFRWHRFRTLSPCRPLVCSCLWRGCQHVSLPTSLSLSLSLHIFQPTPALRRIPKPLWHHTGSVSANTDTSTHISPSKWSPAHDAEGKTDWKVSECRGRTKMSEKYLTHSLLCLYSFQLNMPCSQRWSR